jgi:hypothetical protein
VEEVDPAVVQSGAEAYTKHSLMDMEGVEEGHFLFLVQHQNLELVVQTRFFRPCFSTQIVSLVYIFHIPDLYICDNGSKLYG